MKQNETRDDPDIKVNQQHVAEPKRSVSKDELTNNNEVLEVKVTDNGAELQVLVTLNRELLLIDDLIAHELFLYIDSDNNSKPR